MFCDDRKRSGENAAMARNTTTAIIASLNSGVDFLLFVNDRKIIATAS